MRLTPDVNFKNSHAWAQVPDNGFTLKPGGIETILRVRLRRMHFIFPGKMFEGLSVVFLQWKAEFVVRQISMVVAFHPKSSMFHSLAGHNSALSPSGLNSNPSQLQHLPLANPIFRSLVHVVPSFGL